MIFLMEDFIYSGSCYEGENTHTHTHTHTQHLVCTSNGEGL